MSNNNKFDVNDPYAIAKHIEKYPRVNGKRPEVNGAANISFNRQGFVNNKKGFNLRKIARALVLTVAIGTAIKFIGVDFVDYQASGSYSKDKVNPNFNSNKLMYADLDFIRSYCSLMRDLVNEKQADQNFDASAYNRILNDVLPCLEGEKQLTQEMLERLEQAGRDLGYRCGYSENEKINPGFETIIVFDGNGGAVIIGPRYEKAMYGIGDTTWGAKEKEEESSKKTF